MNVEGTVQPPISRLPMSELRKSLADLLVEYRAVLDKGNSPDPEIWVRKLFRALGWGAETAALRRHRPVLSTAAGAEILECDLFGFEALTIAILPRGPVAEWEARAAEAVTYLYNRGDEWAVVSDFERLEIVNVLWTDKRQAYVPFRRLRWDEYVDEVHTLSLLTPARVRDRDLFEQAAVEAPRKPFEKATPGEPTTRPPISKLVLDQILASREEFLHDPPDGQADADAYDELIHRLLTRLIFIRACEDIQLNVSSSLRTLLSPEATEHDLEQILADYRTLYNSELFDELDLSAFRWDLLKRAVHRLYRVPDVVDFNFGAMEADILGMMYEEYLQWKAVRVENDSPTGQRVLFRLRRVATENVKRKRGIYYTPPYLVEVMVEAALTLLGAPSGWFPDGRPVRAVDLACGSGAFLAEFFERVASSQTGSSYQAAATLLRDAVAGTDIDRRAVEATRLNLWLTLFRLHPRVHPLPRLADTIVARDALLGPYVSPSSSIDAGGAQSSLFDLRESDGAAPPTLGVQPDIVLGNPPFISIEKMGREYRTALESERYSTATGRYDLANLFIERALQVVRVGGIVALVVPNRVFTTAAAASLRRLIGGKAEVVQIIDFGTEQVFQATTYVCVIFLRRLAERPHTTTNRVPVIRVDRFVEPRGLQVREALVAPRPPEGVRRYDVRIGRTSEPVLLVPGRASTLLRKLVREGVRVSALATVAQGIRLGAQPLYLVVEQRESPGADGLIRVHSFGEVGGRLQSATLERDALRPAAHSGDLQRYQNPRTDLWLIYPYEDGRLIPYPEFADRFPQAASYLTRHKERLSRRTTSSPNAWHGIARPRDEEWLSSPKILVPQLANEGRMTLDARGLFLVQGYGIRPKEATDLRWLLGALNSTLLVWLTALKSPKYRGNSFEYQAGILESMPIPKVLMEESTLRAELSSLTESLIDQYNAAPESHSITRIIRLEAEVDALMYAVGNLGPQEIKLVEDEVARFRPKLPPEEALGLLAELRDPALRNPHG